jgi:DNA-binding protein Fis
MYRAIMQLPPRDLWHPRQVPPRSAEPDIEKMFDCGVAQLVHEALAENRGNIYYRVQASIDRIVFREVLDHVKGNQVEAANLLGISRTTLRARMRSLGLVVEKRVGEAAG